MDVATKHLPAWYHGSLPRPEAERVLKENGGAPGLFLVRGSSSGPNFVLSMCHAQMQVSHYQIRSQRIQDIDYLTFDTDTGIAPRFRSLSSVVQHLYSNPGHLPVELGSWVSRPQAGETPGSSTATTAASTSIASSDACSASTTQPDSSSAQEIETPSGFDLSSTTDDMPTLSKTGTLSKVEEQQAMHLGGSVLSIVRDTLTASAADVDEEDLSNEKLYETVQRYSTHIETAPDLKVYSVPQGSDVQAVDAASNKAVNLSVGDELRLIGVEPADTGQGVVVVCKDKRGRSIKFPSSSQIRVLPSELRSQKPSPANTGVDSLHQLQAAISDSSPPSPVTRKASRNMSLADLVADMGGLDLSPSVMSGSRNFFRETLKEGYLSKLPPPRNRIQQWRRRCFRLVLSLNRSLNGGPVYLEYYSRHSSKKPKGVIDLDPIAAVRKPSQADLRDVKGYRSVLQDALFELQMPRRTYRILGSSPSEAQDWMDIIRDVTGLSEDDAEQPPVGDESDKRRDFDCVLLSKRLRNPDARIKFQDKRLQLVCPQTKIALHEWRYTHLKSFGYLRNVAWFEVGTACPTGAGMLCVSSPDAHQMFDSFNYFAPRSVNANIKRRSSRRHNMSWASFRTEGTEAAYETIPEDVDEEERGDTGESKEPQVVFGRLLQPEDLEPVAVAVPLREHFAEKPNEFTFLPGETMRVLATKAFVPQGYLLGQKARQTDFGLIPMECVEVHEHEFGYMRDADDDKSNDSLLDETNADDFEYPKGFDVYGGMSADRDARTAEDEGPYEVPRPPTFHIPAGGRKRSAGYANVK